MSFPASYWRTDRPAEGFYSTALPAHPAVAVRTFLPEGYEPRYAYPLLVILADPADAAGRALDLAPRFSRRNFIALHPGATAGLDPVDTAEVVRLAIEQTRRTYHVHSERVFLVGLGEGSHAAFHTAFQLGHKIGGVVALNGHVPPVAPGVPLFRLDRVRGSRVLFAHDDPAGRVRQCAQLLSNAGASVQLRQLEPGGPGPELFREVNRWVMDRVTAEVAVGG